MTSKKVDFIASTNSYIIEIKLLYQLHNGICHNLNSSLDDWPWMNFLKSADNFGDSSKKKLIVKLQKLLKS
jgi:hypothetical protein